MFFIRFDFVVLCNIMLNYVVLCFYYVVLCFYYVLLCSIMFFFFMVYYV